MQQQGDKEHHGVFIVKIRKAKKRGFSGSPVVKNAPSNAGDKGSIPHQRTISHITQGNYWAHSLWSPHATMKTPCAATKTQCGQTNKSKSKKREISKLFSFPKRFNNIVTYLSQNKLIFLLKG